MARSRPSNLLPLRLDRRDSLSQVSDLLLKGRDLTSEIGIFGTLALGIEDKRSALGRSDHALVSKQANGIANRHLGDAEQLGQLTGRSQLRTRLKSALLDLLTDRAGHSLVRVHGTTRAHGHCPSVAP